MDDDDIADWVERNSRGWMFWPTYLFALPVIVMAWTLFKLARSAVAFIASTLEALFDSPRR